MKTIKIMVEIKDNKTNEKRVQWVRLSSPTNGQVAIAERLYQSLSRSERIRLQRQIKLIKSLNYRGKK